MKRHILVIIILVTLSIGLFSAYLDTDNETRKEPIPPQPKITNEVVSFVQNITVEAPVIYKGYALFPLRLNSIQDSYNYISLDEALKRGFIEISEKRQMDDEDTGEVNQLIARNNSDYYIFLMGGEIVTGGKQDRTLQHDVLLPPHSNNIELPVFCVEHGRWNEESRTFYSKENLLSLDMRGKVMKGAGQAEVWNDVQKELKSVGADSETENLQAALEHPELKERCEEYERAFRKVIKGNYIGWVIASRDRIMGAEIFCNQMLFNKLSKKVLDSYIIDAGEPIWKDKRVLSDAASARMFLNQVYHAEFTTSSITGEGFLMRIYGGDISGAGLIYNGTPLHITLIPNLRILEK